MNKEEILKYHKGGKIGTVVKKELKTSEDLSIIYTPSVAIPALEIKCNPDKVYDYTNKKNKRRCYYKRNCSFRFR